MHTCLARAYVLHMLCMYLLSRAKLIFMETSALKIQVKEQAECTAPKKRVVIGFNSGRMLGSTFPLLHWMM